MGYKIVILAIILASEVILSQTSSDSVYIENGSIESSKKNIIDPSDPLAIQFSFLRGNLIPHAKEVLNVRGKHPIGYKLLFGWQMFSKKVWDNYHSYPRLGLFAEYFDTDFEETLGHGYSAGMFFTYYFGLPSDFNFIVQGEAGLTYLTKPYNKESHKENMSYCTNLNYTLLIGAGINLQFSKWLELQVLLSMNHKSNAAYLEPNGGINYPAISLAIGYIPNPVHFEPMPGDDPYLTSPKKKRWDIALSGGISSMPYPKPGQAPMASVSVLRSIQVARLIAITVAAELEFNGRAKKLMENYYTDINSSYWRASAQFGTEFLLERTIFGVQLGVYFYREYVEGDDIYQRYYLVYNILEHIYTGISFKSYGHFADHLDLKISYSF